MESRISIDINADLGEFSTEKQLANELSILEYITSCSIACGGHVGDANSIKLMIQACKKYNISIGPHPSYPDKEGFGRRQINIDIHDLENSLIEQINLFFNVADSLSVPVSHIKLHGRLYNETFKSERLSNLLIRVVESLDREVSIIGPAKSQIELLAKASNKTFISEAFIDRVYKEDLSLVDRRKKGALLLAVEDQVNQARSIILNHRVITDKKKSVGIEAQTLCMHGDNPNSLKTIKALRQMFTVENINLKPYS